MTYPWTAWAGAASADDRFGLMLTLLDAVPAKDQDHDWAVRKRLVPAGTALAGLYAFVLIGAAALGYLGARQVHRRLRARAHARRRETDRRARLAGARRCHCWQMESCWGEFADEYLRHHLRAEPFDDAPAAVRGTAWLGRCATTDTLWLAVPGSRTLLLRGAVTPQPGERRESVGMYL